LKEGIYSCGVLRANGFEQQLDVEAATCPGSSRVGIIPADSYRKASVRRSPRREEKESEAPGASRAGGR